MSLARFSLVLGTIALAACASAEDDTAAEPSTPPVAAASASATPSCQPMTRMPLAGRASSYDSTVVAVGAAQAKVCYGRPAARGRTVFGELIPFGQLWRTGANEPTTIHVPVAASIAGIRVEPGSYSLYSIPGEREWTIIVNRSTSQWGIESQYTAEIEAQDVGRATVPTEATSAPVETFTITSGTAGTGSELILEWENTRVRVPVTPA